MKCFSIFLNRIIHIYFLNWMRAESSFREKTLKWLIFLTCFQIIGASVFALTMWLRFEPGLDEWITKLELEPFYIGIYVLIALSVIVMLVAFLGCASGLSENLQMLLAVNINGVSFFRSINVGSKIVCNIQFHYILLKYTYAQRPCKGMYKQRRIIQED